MTKVVVIGEILVEIMADIPGQGFSEPIALTGPFPSGAPAIYIDQVALLGQPCAIVSAVGDDDFGRANLDRLRADGVDISAIAIDRDRPTGSAFVRYRTDGARDFVFNIRHSACGSVPQTEAATRILAEAGHLHVMGSSLSSPDFVVANLRAARDIKQRGGSVSFDPNVRKEMLDGSRVRDSMREILSLSDLFLPSGRELTLLTESQDDDGAVRELLSIGVRCVVHKLGAEGVRYHDARGMRWVPAFAVEEVDPTGAGDCFSGAFTAIWLQGVSIDKALRLAAAAGARAVLFRGPMEGTSSRVILDDFIATHHTRR